MDKRYKNQKVWENAKKYRYIGGESTYAWEDGEFTIGNIYERVGDIEWSYGSDIAPDARFICNEGIPLWEDLTCFEIAE